MSILYICRHTETVFNKMGIFSGKLDTPLSNTGLQQAKKLSKFFMGKRIDVVITSSLIRTKETAGIMLADCYADLGFKPPIFTNNLYQSIIESDFLPIISDYRLNERSYGILEGKNKNDMLQKYGEQQLQSWRRSWDSAPLYGETLSEVCNRVKSFFYDIVYPLLENHQNVLVICHQNSMRAIKILIEEIPSNQVQSVEFKNGEIISYSEEMICQKANNNKV